MFVPRGAFVGAGRTLLPRTTWSISPTLRAQGPGSLLGIRYATLEAGENKTGHISAGPNEGILYFDNIFPLRLRWIFRLPFYSYSGKPLQELLGREDVTAELMSGADPAKIIKQLHPDSGPVKVTEVVPRFKEGGAFVKFKHDDTTSSADAASAIKEYLKRKSIKPKWNPFQRIRADLVRGRPWLEDLHRMPSPRLRVEFLPTNPAGQAVELTQEDLYSLFRPYGKLADIVPQPADSKVLPKYANLDFAGMRRASMAKNCMHGYLVSEQEGGGTTGTILKLTYEAKKKTHWIWDWLMNHPRIVIPFVAALVAGATAVLFDPIRTWFIKTHITRKFHVEDNKVYRWFKSQASELFSFHKKYETEPGMKVIWDDRKGMIDQLKQWLNEIDDTFVIVQGPRGSGKRELVDQSLKHKKAKVIIDCKPIQDARGDSATINAAAAEVGYRPVFSWMNSISGMIDLAAQGAAGIKPGFSETLDSQLAKIWNSTSIALKRIALDGRNKDDKDNDLSDDEWLEAHPEKRPVVVIDNFLHKSHESTFIYNKIAEWAARLTTGNIAHVIFLTTDVSFNKSLSEALPDRAFPQLSLSDCSPEVAKRYVVQQIDSGVDFNDDEGIKQLTPSQRRRDLAELDEVIAQLGGRLTELEFLAHRVKTGETPKQAVKEIVESAASDVIKNYLINAEGGSDRPWNPQQAWWLVKQIAEKESVPFNSVQLSDAFKAGGERVLQALEQAEMITIQVTHGRPYAIKPGKPVYLSAFRHLTADTVLKSRLDLAILTESIKVEGATIEKCEGELKLLGELPKQPASLTPRLNYLLGKIEGSQKKIEDYERESAGLKKVLLSDF